PSSRTSGKRNKQGTPKTGLQDKKSAHGRETLAQNQNPTPPGSHRARPVRTEGGAPTTKPNPTPTRRSTRPGCECVPARSHRGGAPTPKPNPTPTRRSTRPGCECVPTPFAPRAVLLQQNQSQLRPVGAPAPGANACPTRSHRGGAPTPKPISTPTRRSTRPGCEYVPAGRSEERRVGAR